MKIKMVIGNLPEITMNLSDSKSVTIDRLLSALPLSSAVERWGDEIYFYVDFKASLEPGARSEMEVGEVAYWPSGPAIAIFFGPTPASKGSKPAAVSECNVIGRVEASPEVLRRAKEGNKVHLRRL